MIATIASREARLRRLAVKDGSAFRKLRGEYPRGGYIARCRYQEVILATNSVGGEWETLEEAEAAYGVSSPKDSP